MKLRATGVTAGAGHRQGARLVLLADLTIDRVARAPGARHALGALTAVEQQPWAMKATDHPVEVKPS